MMQMPVTTPQYSASPRAFNSSILHRVGQIIPDPIALYAHEPKSGQPLSDFPDVFPLAWSPDAG